MTATLDEVALDDTDPVAVAVLVTFKGVDELVLAFEVGGPVFRARISLALLKNSCASLTSRGFEFYEN